jgi:hypothetical protein
VRIESRDRRVEKFLRRHLKAPAWQWGEIGDPRGRRGRRWELAELLNAAFVGMLTASVTLRDVESLTQELGQVGRKQVSRAPARVPRADHSGVKLQGRSGMSVCRRRVCSSSHTPIEHWSSFAPRSAWVRAGDHSLARLSSTPQG